jgi:hypothetical protein
MRRHLPAAALPSSPLRARAREQCAFVVQSIIMDEKGDDKAWAGG